MGIGGWEAASAAAANRPSGLWGPALPGRFAGATASPSSTRTSLLSSGLQRVPKMGCKLPTTKGAGEGTPVGARQATFGERGERTSSELRLQPPPPPAKFLNIPSGRLIPPACNDVGSGDEGSNGKAGDGV